MYSEMRPEKADSRGRKDGPTGQEKASFFVPPPSSWIG